MSTRNHPLAWVPSGYFAMGLPLIMLNLVAPIMFKDLGISDTRVAFWTSLLILPWSLKPLWSPLLEMFRTKKFFVVLTQFLAGISLALVAMTLPLPGFFPYAIAIMAVVAFSGATHDIALDGIYMHELSTSQQAQYIGWQGAFYNIAKVVAMGGLVYLAGVLQSRYGVMTAWMTIMGITGGLLCVLGLYHSWALPRGGERRESSGGFGEVWAVFGDFFRKPHIWIYIAFIFCFRLAEGLVIKIVPLFLKADVGLQGLGLTNEKIGLYYGTFGVIAFVVGSILGGYFISWLKLKRVLFTLVCVFNIPFIVYALLAWFQPSSPLLVCGGIVFEYFSYGFGFVGLNLFIMQQVAPGPHQMAHYAFGTALGNLGVMLPGMISGAISDALGYRQFFLWALLAAIPVLILAMRVPFIHAETDEK
uniref:Transporter, major facilitator family protein n=1 Tax=uncultured bacterium contig00010(2014) TaxID=1465626 RepID=A0A060D1B8_9BACT|nr:putative signal transducer [uncultured bacterium]AIA99577.1 transporter, major facilitator family protein [uncultured bacterium contig00010(2014)]